MATRFIHIYYPPLFLAAASLIMGIIFSAFSWSSLIPLFFFTVSALLLAYASRSNGQFFSRMVILSLCMISFLWGNFWSCYLLTNQVSQQRGLNNQPLSLEGIIIEKNDDVHGPYKQSLLLQLTSLTKHDKTILPSSKKAKIFLKTRLRAEVADVLLLNNVYMSEMHDFYQLRDSILITAFIRKPQFIVKTTSHLPLLIKINCLFTQVRDSVARSLKNKMKSDNFFLFSSLFLGAPVEKTVEMDFLKQRFAEWGISHYLARSGLHVVIMLLLWQAVMRMIPLGIILKNIILLCIVGICTALSWSSVSFTRAIISYGITRFCLFGKVQVLALNTVALACIFVLCINPFHLFFLNFQLSFLLALALAWIAEIDLHSKKRDSHEKRREALS